MDTLKEFRRSTGLSQDSMARKLGCTVSMYTKVESGRAQPSRGFMVQLKAAFPEASVDEIFFSEYIVKK